MEVINGGMPCGWHYALITVAYIGLIASTGPFGASLALIGLAGSVWGAGETGC